MKIKPIYISSLFIVLIITSSAQVFAQGSNDETRPSTQTLPPKLLLPEDMPPPKKAGIFDPDHPGQNQAQQELERKLMGGALMITSVPLFLLGLSNLAKKGKRVGGRDITAHKAGSQLFAGMGMATQGATLLLKDGKEAKAREHLTLKTTRERTLLLLEKEANNGRKSRNTKATLFAVSGVIVGAVVGALPVSDRTVDRRLLVSAGLGIATAGIGAGIYTYLTDSMEEQMWKEALSQREQMFRQRIKTKEPTSK